ncbi:hypothetical protein [Xylanimonas sp. McL0601]|uniref:SLOG cluster 4 domain-containing protein n=1 Tax=Xylanimonas sp. McL0601 TaxID=3414739 RepID=UPI003CF489CB
MTPHRTAPVIAVFGSDVERTVAPARAAGEAVARSGAVLLTGGGRRPAERSVKEQAMNGARDAEAAGERAARVGVLGAASREVRIEVAGSQVILEPGLSHARNYVNAAMCDVAIAFHGGRGTDSEVVFALALGRPVVLAGAEWDHAFPPGEDRAGRLALVASARSLVPGDQDTSIDDHMRRAYDELLAARLRVERLGLDEPPARIVACARRLVEEAGLQGDLPALADRPDVGLLAERYRDWLGGLELPAGCPDSRSASSPRVT